MVSTKSIKQLYNTLAYPHPTYGVIPWGGKYSTHIAGLSIAQKKIIRAIANEGRQEHTHQDIYKLEMSKFMFQFINGQIPRSLSNIFTYTHETHDHATLVLKLHQIVSCVMAQKPGMQYKIELRINTI